LSLPVVARRLKVPIAALDDRPGANARDHDLVTLVHHPKERRRAAETALPAAPRKPVDAERIAVDVGICVHDSLEETRACLDALLAARRPHDRIVVIDDASGAPTAAFLDQFARDHDSIILRRHEQNRGYTASANAFFSEGQADWMLLLNSDTVVPPRALTKLVRCGEQFDVLGAVGPLSNAASWQTVPRLTGPDGKFLVNALPAGLGVEDMDRLCEELAPAPVLFAPLLNGFCLTIRRAMLEKIGPFDEASFPMGYGEEDDFCLRAGAAGYLCGIAPDTYVYHVKSASFTPAGRKPLAEAGAKALRQKHSAERIGAAVAMMREHPELARMRERLASRDLAGTLEADRRPLIHERI
jgi:GT2 family glycosyltransferase